MPKPASPAAVISDIRSRYANGDFIETYNNVCGDAGTYPDPQVAANFDAFLSSEIAAGSKTYRDMLAATNPELASRVASDAFAAFLDNGNMCHPSTPARRAIVIADLIGSSNDVVEAHRGWRSFLMHFENFVEKLRSIIEKSVLDTTATDLGTANRIVATVDGFEPFAKKLDERLEPLSHHMPNALRVIIGIQIAATREIRSLALALRLPSNAQTTREWAFLVQIAESLLSSVDDFNDPFVWAKKSYTRIKEIEELYYQSASNRQIDVNVTVSDEHPVLRSDDALVAKEILDHVMFASMLLSSASEPVDMNISWDEDLNAMVITSNKVLQTTRHPVWREVSTLLLDMGGRFDVLNRTTGSGQIIIPIKTTDGMASPVPTTGPGSEPDDAPTMTGSSARNLSWPNVLSARNLLFFPQLTAPALFLFNPAVLRTATFVRF